MTGTTIQDLIRERYSSLNYLRPAWNSLLRECHLLFFDGERQIFINWAKVNATEDKYFNEKKFTKVGNVYKTQD